MKLEVLHIWRKRRRPTVFFVGRLEVLLFPNRFKMLAQTITEGNPNLLPSRDTKSVAVATSRD